MSTTLHVFFPGIFLLIHVINLLTYKDCTGWILVRNENERIVCFDDICFRYTYIYIYVCMENHLLYMILNFSLCTRLELAVNDTLLWH